eukprot:2630564-Prymnesium_polylepis.2
MCASGHAELPLGAWPTGLSAGTLRCDAELVSQTPPAAAGHKLYHIRRHRVHSTYSNRLGSAHAMRSWRLRCVSPPQAPRRRAPIDERRCPREQEP